MKGTITITGEGNNDAAKRADKRNKGVIFNNCASFTDCISETNNTQINNTIGIDVVKPMYNLIQYSDQHQEVYGDIMEMNQILL